MTAESELQIFTLNCWGIPVISNDRLGRFKAIAEVLGGGKYDLVCLQEVWDTQDYFFLKKCLQQVLPFSHYFYSGVLGSGLCVFSKFPFQDVFFHQWSLNGYVHKIQHGDWFGGKGIGLCTLKIRDMTVNLYTAHLHAEYDRTNDEYLSHRVLQAFDTAQFVRLTSKNCDLVILGGDLNTEPSDLSYRILCSEAQLEDAFVHAGNIPEDCIGTNESERNSYSDNRKLQLNPRGKRIDYVLFRTGPSVQLKKINYGLPLPPRVPSCSFSYSDHEAVSASVTLSRNTGVEESSSYKIDAALHKQALNEGLLVCNEALQKLARDKYFYWIASCTLFLVLLSICSTSPPYEMHSLYKIFLSVISALMCFTGFMCFIWNRMEVNGIMAGKLAMELACSKCQGEVGEESSSKAGLFEEGSKFS
ncbi:hypothetical protein R5R35_001811 [Gryllus longicercus]|uniref:sphingomyelin phosphodiesterase n=1 Tax=Gryllus longicercus TaxID=2509291 RepID=A0AAN9VU61_9ORTH